MERVLGKVQQDLREDEECWVVSDEGVELRAFETLWRANEWRRTAKIYRSYVQAIGVRYYLKESDEWYCRAAAVRDWQKVEDKGWVESAIQERDERLKRMLSFGLGVATEP